MSEDAKEEIVDQSDEVAKDSTTPDGDDPGVKIAELTQLVAEEKEKALRARADFENFRKRKDAEVDSFRQYANEKLIVEFLPVVDSIDRALESMSNPDASPVVEGVQLIHKQLITTLEKLGVSSFASIDAKFDPNLHMAVSEESVEGVEPGTVVKEFQRGYQLHSRVIRPAMVVVAK